MSRLGGLHVLRVANMQPSDLILTSPQLTEARATVSHRGIRLKTYGHFTLPRLART